MGAFGTITLQFDKLTVNSLLRAGTVTMTMTGFSNKNILLQAQDRRELRNR